jgi:hypothetical protein
MLFSSGERDDWLLRQFWFQGHVMNHIKITNSFTSGGGDLFMPENKGFYSLSPTGTPSDEEVHKPVCALAYLSELVDNYQ